MVQARVVAQGEQRASGAGLGVGGAVDEAGDAGVDEGAGAHRAGLEGDVEGGAVDPPAAGAATGLAEGDDLGVAGGVGVGLAGVEADAGDAAVLDDEGADGDVAAGGEKAGIRAAKDTLKIAEGPKDVARAARLAEAKGGQTRAILKVLGRGAARVVSRVSGTAMVALGLALLIEQVLR